jgi:hypothetical protein
MEYKSQNVICQNCKKDLTIEPDDFRFYEKMKVPPPTFCPECRAQRRFSWRNERSLYHRECNRCKVSLVSIFSKEKPFPIYCNECWWGDKWEATDYAQNYDPTRSFLSQLEELFNKVPHLAFPNYKNVNCEYTSWLDESRNCYMAFGSSRCEDVLFSETLVDCKYSMDLTNCNKTEYSFNSIYCHNSNNVHYCVNCDSCVACYFCFDLKGCQNCFLSYNLRHKNYMILNKQYSREKWKKEMEKILGNRKSMEKYLTEFKKIMKNKAVHRFAVMLKTYNSSGNNLSNSKNALACFDSQNIENCQHITYGDSLKDCADLFVAVKNTELCYEGFSITESSNCSKNFKIIKQEFDSYRKLNVPIPDKCIDCRFKERLEFCLSRKLWHRKCMKEGCQNEFETSYAPDRPEIVYCERCYQQEVY